jgi:hypothetical protein
MARLRRRDRGAAFTYDELVTLEDALDAVEAR